MLNTVDKSCAAVSAKRNCDLMKVQTGTCSTCAPGYYLVNNVCTAGTTISGCLMITSTNAGCDVCNTDYYQSISLGGCTLIKSMNTTNGTYTGLAIWKIVSALLLFITILK